MGPEYFAGLHCAMLRKSIASALRGVARHLPAGLRSENSTRVRAVLPVIPETFSGVASLRYRTSSWLRWVFVSKVGDFIGTST
jgi:hypothetical protein